MTNEILKEINEVKLQKLKLILLEPQQAYRKLINTPEKENQFKLFT